MVSSVSTKRMKALFSGRVQGVGFRYTVCRLAPSFRVTGFVKNLINGDVEVVAEGCEQELVDFLNEIRGSHLGRYITHERVSWTAATDRYDEFRISY